MCCVVQSGVVNIIYFFFYMSNFIYYQGEFDFSYCKFVIEEIIVYYGKSYRYLECIYSLFLNNYRYIICCVKGCFFINVLIVFVYFGWIS